MKRISKKTRDEAILICAIAASSNEFNAYIYTCRSLGIYHDDSLSLACHAFNAVLGRGRDHSNIDDSCTLDAEAECLLRDGWSPGDPVEVL